MIFQNNYTCREFKILLKILFTFWRASPATCDLTRNMKLLLLEKLMESPRRTEILPTVPK